MKRKEIEGVWDCDKLEINRNEGLGLHEKEINMEGKETREDGLGLGKLQGNNKNNNNYTLITISDK